MYSNVIHSGINTVNEHRILQTPRQFGPFLWSLRFPYELIDLNLEGFIRPHPRHTGETWKRNNHRRVILDYCLRKTRARKSRDCRDVIGFEKLRFQTIFVYDKTPTRCFQIPPVKLGDLLLRGLEPRWRVPDFRNLGSRPRTSRPRNLQRARIKNSKWRPQTQNTRDNATLIIIQILNGREGPLCFESLCREL